MRRLFSWQVILGLSLVALSAIVYWIHYLIFHDVHHIFIYLVGDIAFVFIEVLLVTLIMHNLLAHREKQSMLKKLNMVIGAFFSEAGKEIIGVFTEFDTEASSIQRMLIVQKDWARAEFLKISTRLKKRDYSLDIKKGDIGKLKNLLISKRGFLLNLLENPNLLEHENFTNLLWAVFHLTEELSARNELINIPESDAEHLANDIKRAYRLLLLQWLAYMQHLKNDYPYLFSLAMRTNPFDSDAKVPL